MAIGLATMLLGVHSGPTSVRGGAWKRGSSVAGDADLFETLAGQSRTIQQLTDRLKAAEAKVKAESERHAILQGEAKRRIAELEISSKETEAVTVTTPACDKTGELTRASLRPNARTRDLTVALISRHKLLHTGAHRMSMCPPPPTETASNAIQSYPAPYHNFGSNQECDARFGLGLADVIARTKVTVCKSEEDEAIQSSMDCYPHQHQHKKGSGRWDMFCVAHNFVVDFGKVEEDGGPASFDSPASFGVGVQG